MIKKYFEGLEIDFGERTASRVTEKQKRALWKNSALALLAGLISFSTAGGWSVAAGALAGWFLFKLFAGLAYLAWYRAARNRMRAGEAAAAAAKSPEGKIEHGEK